jgi:hypothetical protein
MEYRLNDEWERRFTNCLNHNLDGCVSALLYQLHIMVVRWLVVLVLTRHETTEQSNIASNISELTRVAERNETVVGIAGCTYSCGDDPVRLWSEILEAQDIDADAAISSVPEQFTELVSGESNVQVCHFCTYAHPNAVHAAVSESQDMVSGYVALSRTLDTEDWRRELLSLEHSGQQYRLFSGDPSRACGVAVAIPGSFSPFVVLSPGVSIDAPRVKGVIELSLPAVFAPFDAQELERIEKAHINPLVSHVVDVLANRGLQESMTHKLQKAFHFWSKAELRRSSLADIQCSSWSLGELFLDYCMTLEILLGEKAEVVQLLSSRAASLLADDWSDRLDVFQLVKELYGKRSQYVHEGTITIQYADVSVLRNVVRQCLLYALLWTASVSAVARRLKIRSCAAPQNQQLNGIGGEFTLTLHGLHWLVQGVKWPMCFCRAGRRPCGF